MHAILRLPEVKKSTGLSRSTIYLRISQGTFPKPVCLGRRAVGWPLAAARPPPAYSVTDAAG